MNDFLKAIIRHSAGLRVDLVEAALNALALRIESPSLVILAGLSDRDDLAEKEKYFLEALRELEYPVYDKRTAVIELMKLLVDDILSGKQDLILGMEEIERNCLYQWDFHGESKEFLYDSIGFALVYGLYDRYIDITADEKYMRLYYPGEELEKIKTALKGDLMAELKNWRKVI